MLGQPVACARLRRSLLTMRRQLHVERHLPIERGPGICATISMRVLVRKGEAKEFRVISPRRADAHDTLAASNRFFLSNGIAALCAFERKWRLLPEEPELETGSGYWSDRPREPRGRVAPAPRVAARPRIVRRTRPSTPRTPTRPMRPSWCRPWARSGPSLAASSGPVERRAESPVAR